MDTLLDLENPLPISHEQIDNLFLSESHHMPSYFSLNLLSIRFQIISNIKHFSLNFDPFLPYLATNYLDRFLSTQSIPEGKPWISSLIAISCVSLALKMLKTEYSFSDSGGFMFDAQTIERMELMILGALKWRMRSITPFGFFNFFISLFKFKDSPSCLALKQRATEIIFKSQNGLICSEFKPSIVAASALLYASHELFPLQFPCFRNAISDCSYIHKENFYTCYNAIQDIMMDSYDLAMVSSSSALDFDLHCSSLTTSPRQNSANSASGSGSGSGSGSDTSNNTVVVERGSGSGSGTIRLERDLKRRKITCFGSTNSFQLSQVSTVLKREANESGFLEGDNSWLLRA